MSLHAHKESTDIERLGLKLCKDAVDGRLDGSPAMRRACRSKNTAAEEMTIGPSNAPCNSQKVFVKSEHLDSSPRFLECWLRQRCFSCRKQETHHLCDCITWIALSNAEMPPRTPSAVSVGKRCEPGTCAPSSIHPLTLATHNACVQITFKETMDRGTMHVCDATHLCHDDAVCHIICQHMQCRQHDGRDPPPLQYYQLI